MSSSGSQGDHASQVIDLMLKDKKHSPSLQDMMRANAFGVDNSESVGVQKFF
jgi:hypothetical protein